MPEEKRALAIRAMRNAQRCLEICLRGENVGSFGLDEERGLMDSIEMDCASLYTILVRVLHWMKRRNADRQMFVLHSLLLSSFESLDSFQMSSI